MYELYNLNVHFASSSYCFIVLFQCNISAFHYHFDHSTIISHPRTSSIIVDHINHRYVHRYPNRAYCSIRKFSIDRSIAAVISNCRLCRFGWFAKYWSIRSFNYIISILLNSKSKRGDNTLAFWNNWKGWKEGNDQRKGHRKFSIVSTVAHFERDPPVEFD